MFVNVTDESDLKSQTGIAGLEIYKVCAEKPDEKLCCCIHRVVDNKASTVSMSPVNIQLQIAQCNIPATPAAWRWLANHLFHVMAK